MVCCMLEPELASFERILVSLQAYILAYMHIQCLYAYKYMYAETIVHAACIQVMHMSAFINCVDTVDEIPGEVWMVQIFELFC